MKQWGALFDFDGVIIDSAFYHEKSWEVLAEEEGRSLPEGHFKKGFGRKNAFIIPEILKWAKDPEEIHRIGARKEELYRELVRSEGIEPLPGVREWLNTLRAANIPCAIGSSTEKKNLDCVLEAIGLKDHFKAIISADDVNQGKPHPQVFLIGSEKIGIPPEYCVVFEDAHVGIEAALAGGMKVVGVATTHPKEALTDAHIVVERLDELSVNLLESLQTC